MQQHLRNCGSAEPLMRPDAGTKGNPKQFRHKTKPRAAEEWNQIDDGHGGSSRAHISSWPYRDDENIRKDIERCNQDLKPRGRAHERNPGEDMRIDKAFQDKGRS